MEFRGEVDSAYSLLTNIAGNYAPKIKKTTQYSTFFQMVLKRAEVFVHAELQDNDLGLLDGKLKVQAKVKRVRGSVALRRIYDIATEKAGAGTLTGLDLKCLKVFQWMLSAEQVAQVACWTKIVGATTDASRMLTEGASASGTSACSAIVPSGKGGGACAASSSSSSSACAAEEDDELPSSPPVKSEQLPWLSRQHCPGRAVSWALSLLEREAQSREAEPDR